MDAWIGCREREIFMDITPADIAKNAENLLDENEPDAFPPEGTDEAALDPDVEHVLDEDDRLKATRAVIKGGY